MVNFFSIILLLSIAPYFWVSITQSDSLEDIKLQTYMSSMAVGLAILILSQINNEDIPGFIFAAKVFGSYYIAYDGVSLLYLAISTGLTALCMTCIYEFVSVNEKIKKALKLVILLQFVLINFFLVRDLMFFYVWFEASLPVLFLIVLLGGERNIKVRAAFMLFIYTLIFSMFTLCTIVFLVKLSGVSDFFDVLLCDFTWLQQIIIYLGFLIGFSVKIPTNPFHVWLPHAHVEANTLGSVLLAGIILKMGGYAIFRFLLPLCPVSYNDYAHVGSVLGYMSVINTSLIIITESDMKRLIAYFSIVHMNVALIAIFAYEKLAILGSMAMMVSHSLIASGLFFCIGILYERYQHRDMSYYGGLANAHINFCVAFFILILSNFSFPLTFSFWPEIVILTGLAIVSYFDVVVILISSIFGVASNLIFFSRVFFSHYTEFLAQYCDINMNEMYFLWAILFFNFYYGIFPMSYMKFLDEPVNFLLTALAFVY